MTKAIAGMAESAWTPIKYPNAIWDEDEQRFISDAEVAEVPFTAFTSRRKSEHVDGRLIVRRVKRLKPSGKAGQTGGFLTASRRTPDQNRGHSPADTSSVDRG